MGKMFLKAMDFTYSITRVLTVKTMISSEDHKFLLEPNVKTSFYASSCTVLPFLTE